MFMDEHNEIDAPDELSDEEIKDLLERSEAIRNEDPRRPREELPPREQAVESCMDRAEDLLDMNGRNGLDMVLFEYETLRELPTHASAERVQLARYLAQAYHETVHGDAYELTSLIEGALETAEEVDNY